MNTKIKGLTPFPFTPFMVLVALLLVGAACLVLYSRDHDSRAERDKRGVFLKFEETAGSAIAFVKSQHAQTGRYPSHMPERLQTELTQTESRWWYKVSTNGLSCYLGYGNYAKDGFEYYWASDTDAWMWDE